jgi:hypothetical protein
MLAGFTYVGAWVAGLGAFGTGAGTDATETEVVRYFHDHRLTTTVQGVLVHGVAAAALLTVLVAVRRAGASNRTSHTAGVIGVALSLVQCLLDVWRSALSTGAATADLVEVIDRIDGVKMFAFALMIGAGVPTLRAMGLIGRRMSAVGGLAALALVVSGAAYAASIDGLLVSAAVSLVLLLGWVAFEGVVAARRIH